jgi:hypothetical protein
MGELVWKEIRQLQKQVEFLNEYRKAQTRINAELSKQLSTAKEKEMGTKRIVINESALAKGKLVIKEKE